MVHPDKWMNHYKRDWRFGEKSQKNPCKKKKRKWKNRAMKKEKCRGCSLPRTFLLKQMTEKHFCASCNYPPPPSLFLWSFTSSERSGWLNSLVFFLWAYRKTLVKSRRCKLYCMPSLFHRTSFLRHYCNTESYPKNALPESRVQHNYNYKWSHKLEK